MLSSILFCTSDELFYVKREKQNLVESLFFFWASPCHSQTFIANFVLSGKGKSRVWELNLAGGQTLERKKLYLTWHPCNLGFYFCHVSFISFNDACDTSSPQARYKPPKACPRHTTQLRKTMTHILFYQKEINFIRILDSFHSFTAYRSWDPWPKKLWVILEHEATPGSERKVDDVA